VPVLTVYTSCLGSGQRHGTGLGRADSQSGVATETYDALNRLVTYQYSAGTVTMSLDQTSTKRDQLATQSRYSDLSGTHLIGTTS
jgi:hypothetical protein